MLGDTEHLDGSCENADLTVIFFSLSPSAGLPIALRAKSRIPTGPTTPYLALQPYRGLWISFPELP